MAKNRSGEYGYFKNGGWKCRLKSTETTMIAIDSPLAINVAQITAKSKRNQKPSFFRDPTSL
jgi:hypothetical protein